VLAPPMTASPLRVATFNLRREGAELDAGDLWEARKHEVVKLLRHLNVDVIGLQEVQPRQCAFLADALAGEFSCVGDGREADRRGESSPIFFRTPAFEVLRSSTSWLSASPGEPGSIHPGALCPRVVTCAALRRHDGCEFFCFNTHLDHAGMVDPDTDFGVQREQALVLTQIADEFCGGARLARLLLGDLNSGPAAGAPPVFAAAGYVDASFGDEGPTFCGFDGAGGETTRSYGVSKKLVTKIDWIFATEMSPQNYKVVLEKYQDPQGVMRNFSDHLAVTAEFVFPADP